MNQKRGQISTEYLIIIAFVLFLVLSALGIAYYYSNETKDAIKFNQVESFSQKLISYSESVFYSGYPARTTFTAYLPEGITGIEIIDNYVVFNITTGINEAVVAYKSNVNLTGAISTYPGIKKIYLNASSDGNSVIVQG